MTEEQLREIEECGAAEMPVDETCLIVQVTEREFETDEAARLAYRKGQLRSKLAVRKTVVELAKQGDPRMVRIYLDFNRDEVDVDSGDEMEGADEL